ncbi:MAG TPA: hypothetical protein DDY98_02055 [Ruminococcaceae bacterium]|nr:hypothetical protein [Oscillospiraceae bacterium]
MKKRLIALLLCVALVLTGGSMTAFAAEEYSASEQVLYRVGEKAIQGIVGGIAALVPTPYSWQTEKQYKKTHDFSLNTYGFNDSYPSTPCWSVGYSSRSLQTGRELVDECYVGGSLAVDKKLATNVYDDQRVRTVAMSDGRGITVFASLDAFGLANSEVQKIRGMLASYAKANNIKSINISTLHQHSCVDTYGMNGDLLNAFFLGGIRNLLGLKNPSGQNEAFMNNLYTKVQESVKEAVSNMKQGKLYYGNIDISEYIRDKRDPQVIDGNMNRLRFVPNGGGREIWLINQAIHCVGLGAAGRNVTGDYPYYMEKYINEKGNADFILIQVAELAISSQYEPIDKLPVDQNLVAIGGDGYARLALFGEALGKKACAIQDSEELTPSIDYASQAFTVNTENNILLLAAKCGLLTNTIVRAGIGKYKVVSEVGFVQFGNRIAVVIAPGELAAEIAYGGAMRASESWTGTSWNFPSFKDTMKDKKVLVFGLTNDQIGYMLTDNSWHSFLCENEEIVAAGSTAGSEFTAAFYALYRNLPVSQPRPQ